MCDKCGKFEVKYPDGRVFKYGRHWIHIVDDLSFEEIIELKKYLEKKIQEQTTQTYIDGTFVGI
jgi:hypothetical protein